MALGRTAVARLHHQYILFASDTPDHVAQGILEGIGVVGWMRAQPVFTRLGEQIVLGIAPSMKQEVLAAALLCSPPLVVRAVSGTLAGLRRKQ